MKSFLQKHIKVLFIATVALFLFTTPTYKAKSIGPAATLVGFVCTTTCVTFANGVFVSILAAMGLHTADTLINDSVDSNFEGTISTEDALDFVKADSNFTPFRFQGVFSCMKLPMFIDFEAVSAVFLSFGKCTTSLMALEGTCTNPIQMPTCVPFTP